MNEGQSGSGSQFPAGEVRHAQPVNLGPPMPPSPPVSPLSVVMAPPPARRGHGWLIILGLLLLSSVFLNVLTLALWAVTLSKPDAYQTRVLQEGASKEVVAVVPIYDLIDGAVAAWTSQLLRVLSEDDSVRAVVLHVDTPGGTVAASDQINHLITKFREETGKPVVVSQGGYATSGGYYVSAAGDCIVAEPTTWTGNIGVIMTTFVARKGLEEKLGIKPVVIVSSHTPFKDVPSLFRDMRPDEQQYLEGLVESAYQRFVDVVAAGRTNLKRDRIEELANGKVYTAKEAKALGLIDEIGYFEDACRIAGERADLGSPHVVLYSPRPMRLADILFGTRRVPALEQFGGDPSRIAEGMLAPRLMYLYHNQGLVRSWPIVQYPGQP